MNYELLPPFEANELKRSICSNDAYDFSTGADKNKKESVVKLVGR